MKCFRLSVLLLVSVVAAVQCYSTGAPASACADIYPVGHSGTSQDLATNPFQLSLSDFDQTYGGETYYVPGQQYTLTLSGSGGEQFRGFLVQARNGSHGVPVGVFFDNGDDQALSSCSPPESAVTHTNNSLKSSVTFTWTAPSQIFGNVRFLYSIVVENSPPNSTFYATAKSNVLHSCGLPLFESAGQCVETCPHGEFGNGTSGACQQLPSGFIVALNATVYHANIHTDYPLNTPVFRIRAIIRSIDDLLDLSISLSQTGEINDIFEFAGGSVDDRIGITQADLVQEGDQYVFDTVIVMVEDPVDVLGEITEPEELDIDVSLVGLFLPDQAVQEISQATGQIINAPDPCNTATCENGGTCVSVSSVEYTCSCAPGYTGMNCEQVEDPCLALTPCENQATCETISSSEYTCHCPEGYTGDTCAEIGDSCLVFEPCVNGNCTPGAGSSYSCDCFTGFTGTDCDMNINDCAGIECVNGTCVDGIADYTCECDPGFTGTLCDQDINECITADCNSGTCTDLVNDYVCSCHQDYTGRHCETFLSCGSSPCGNEGTCVEEPLSTFSCLCPPEWTGMTCSKDVFPCDPNPCLNGGSCLETQNEYSCNCTVGWTGRNCSLDIDECVGSPCENGGTCTNTEGSYGCECPGGFSGTLCGEDLDFCGMLQEACLNGVCVEGHGSDTSCNCSLGFTGDTCADDDGSLFFCGDSSCVNGGTCNEGYGPQTNCSCIRGFTGDSCTDDDPSQRFCDDNSCLNGGTCEEAFGDATVCMCPLGYTGPSCTTVVCHSGTCMNGGTCMEQVGTLTSITCFCLNGFTGAFCEEDIDTFCTTSPRDCFNGGSCVEGNGNETSCECARGFMGENCTEDDSDEVFCDDTLCINGGTCHEDFGPATVCECAPGFTGEGCKEDNPVELFCDRGTTTCANGGTCSEGYGPQTTCKCIRGFAGETCTEDNPTEVFCNDNSCANGGSCAEEFGNATVCHCLFGFSGPNCSIDLDFCTNSTCKNGGTCLEAVGSETLCSCPCEYTGLYCEENVFSCASDPCENGATCIEQALGSFKCLCSPEWMGKACNTRASTHTRSDSKVPALLGIIGGMAVIIILLCGLCLVSFGLACKYRGKRFFFRTAEPQQYNLDSVASFDAFITSNYTNAVDLSCDGQQATMESESQEERWQFGPEDGRHLEQEDVVAGNESASPTTSLVQYHLSLALTAVAETKEELTQVNHHP